MKQRLVFSENYAKINHLLILAQTKDFQTYKYKNGLMPLTQVKNNYPFFIYEHYQISPDLSKRFIPYFDYIKLDEIYHNHKLILLQKIKKSLIENKLLIQDKLDHYDQILVLDKAFVPKGLRVDEEINFIKAIDTDIEVFQSKDVNEQVYACFEKVISLIEMQVPLSQIKIVNTNSEDDYHLQRLFNDANVPLSIRKPVSIQQYPLYKDIKMSLINHGLEETKNLLLDLRFQHNDLVNACIHHFNLYLDSDIQKHLDVFIHQLDQVKINPKRLKNAIEIIEVDQITDLNHHYLMMNYIDEVFPKKDIDNDYLSNKEKEIIKYPRSEEINQYRLHAYEHLFNGLKNIYLFYPKVTIDETRLANLKLSRKTKEIIYKYLVKEQSYLPTDDLLRYASHKDLNDNYMIEREDYPILKSHFQSLFHPFNKQFTGIHPEDLQSLLQKKYTITGTKIETYKLCPFQYLLKYLLDFEEFEDSHYLYFGNKIHQSLENLVKDSNYDYVSMIHESRDFPEDILYKKNLYQEILIENIDKISKIVLDFIEHSAYKKILTEYKFSEKIKEEDLFLINGIIDKVMIDEETGHYIIVDYKYSQKSFSIKEMEKGQKLQLPFYLYVFNKNHDLKASGIFYRQSGVKKEKADQETDYRMNGVFLNDANQMRRLDPQEKHIKSLKFTNQGLWNYGSNISESDFDKMMDLMENMIYQTSALIEKGHFPIEPNIGDMDQKEAKSCRYCSFAHLCYSKNQIIEEPTDDLYQTSE